jgi:hypothetical protein
MWPKAVSPLTTRLDTDAAGFGDAAAGRGGMAQIGGIAVMSDASDSQRPTNRAAPTPSISAWRILPTTANPPPWRPSMTWMVHNGCALSSGLLCRVEMRSSSCSGLPGAGNAWCRTW